MSRENSWYVVVYSREVPKSKGGLFDLAGQRAGLDIGLFLRQSRYACDPCAFRKYEDGAARVLAEVAAERRNQLCAGE